MNKYSILILAVINIITFWTYASDKKRAIKGKRRISEQTLLTLVLIGGSVGALFSMFAYKHKTSKMSFMLKYIALVVFQCLAIYIVVNYHS